MHQAAVDLFQLLVQAGAIPGQDFSCDAAQQAYHLNERCYGLLQDAYPDVDWQDILGDPYAELEKRIEALHEQLGCAFVSNLLMQMRDRLAQLPDDGPKAIVVATDGAPVSDGIVWRVFSDFPDADGQLPLVHLARGGLRRAPRPGGLEPRLASERGCTGALIQHVVARIEHGARDGDRVSVGR